MDYEKMYNELKVEHDTLVTTFDTYKETSNQEKEELEGKLEEKDTLISEKDNKIEEVQKANMNLYLQTTQQQETPKPNVPEKSLEQILNEIEKEI